MSLTMKDTGGGSFTPVAAGNYVAVCYAVIDLGTQHSEAFTWEGKAIPASTRPQVLLMWEIPGETFEVDGEQKPAVISKFFNAFFNDKAALRQALESWRGRQFTEEELCAFDLKSVLGKGCMINVVHDAKGRAKIAGIAALPKGVHAPKPVNPLVTIDFDDFNQVSFDSLSEGIQNIIKKSPEWTALQAPKPVGFRDHTPPDFADDDIPF